MRPSVVEVAHRSAPFRTRARRRSASRRSRAMARARLGGCCRRAGPGGTGRRSPASAASVRIASSAASRSRRSNGRPSRSWRCGSSSSHRSATVSSRRQGDIVRRRPPEPLINADAIASSAASSYARPERRPGHAALEQERAALGIVREQPHGALTVPEAERLGLVHASKSSAPGPSPPPPSRPPAVAGATSFENGASNGSPSSRSHGRFSARPSARPAAPDLSSGKRSARLGRARVGIVGPDDHGRAGPGQRRADRARRQLRADRVQQRRGPVGLVQPVGEGGRQQAHIALREPGAEQRGAGDIERGVRMGDLRRQRHARLGGLHLLPRDHRHRRRAAASRRQRAIRPSHVRQTPPARQAARLSECPSNGAPRASSSSGESS